MAEQKPKFEKDLERLEAIVESLEEGGLTLDDSLKKFEEGIKLAKRCEKALSDVEKKIEILTKNSAGELETQPFEDGPINRRGEQRSESSMPAENEVDTDESSDDGNSEDEDEDGLLF